MTAVQTSALMGLNVYPDNLLVLSPHYSPSPIRHGTISKHSIARPLRIDYADAVYHITPKGNVKRGDLISKDHKDWGS